MYLYLRVWSPVIDKSGKLVTLERKDNNHRKFPIGNVRTGKAWAIWAMEHQLLPPPPSPKSQNITMHSKLGTASALGSDLGFSCKWNMSSIADVCLSAIAEVYLPMWKPGLVSAHRKSSPGGEVLLWEHSDCWHAWSWPVNSQEAKAPHAQSVIVAHCLKGEFQRDFESSWTRDWKTLSDDAHKSGTWINDWTGKTEFFLRSGLSLTWRSGSQLSEGINTMKCASLLSSHSMIFAKKDKQERVILSLTYFHRFVASR